MRRRLSTDQNPHTLNAYLRGIDLIPYVAVLAVPFAWAFWAMGAPGNASSEQLGSSWWFKGYVALLLYVPSMALCGLIELMSRRRNWPGVRIGITLFRWVHFWIAIGPIIVIIAAILIPPLGRLIS